MLALRDQPFKALHVELAVLDANEISRSARLQHSGTEYPAQPGDIDLKRLASRFRRGLAPQHVDDLLGGREAGCCGRPLLRRIHGETDHSHPEASEPVGHRPLVPVELRREVNRSRLPGHLIAGNRRQNVGIDAVNVETSPRRPRRFWSTAATNVDRWECEGRDASNVTFPPTSVCRLAWCFPRGLRGHRQPPDSVGPSAP